MKHIRLSIERFWIEPGNFELWCEYLSRIPEQTEAKSMKEIASFYLNKDVIEKDKKLDRSKELFGLLGYEYFKRTSQFEIKGVLFLERFDGHLQITEDAKKIVNSYINDDGWEVLLARQLLRFSPRVRVVIHMLLNGGYFNTNGTSLDFIGRWQLDMDGTSYHPFASNPQKNDMNHLLEQFKVEALGNEWMKLLLEKEVELEEGWSFIGSGGKEPAITNLTAFMRAPMQLFEYLDWFIKDEGGKVILNIEKISNDIDDLGSLFTISPIDSVNELHTLRESIHFLSDDRGFFSLEPVLEPVLIKHYPSWGKGLSRFVDYYITNGINKGIFTVTAHESGQPRHGRGYLGKREYQLIKLDIHR
ncbi:hypothetical protein GLV94_18570 [Virgibacillus halodenitrificans]|uniref:hypothetical protein n=1 Tax=Virgibacillus halodenitrificans TaxID=1482 RepID=UPI0013694A84|nr:hypothetical protein [Virgibacillus halodenitrificans]MYL47647.1 hypothetical protein [Virgibacillus halodenitrificans]